MKKYIASAACLAATTLLLPLAQAHEIGAARHIANEGILVSAGDVKIMFDPLALSGFGTYPEITAEDKSAMFAGEGDFDGIDVIFISHAHSDHFSAIDMIDYMNVQTDVRLVMPKQAIDLMQKEAIWSDDLAVRIEVLDLEYGHEAVSLTLGGVETDIMRIPHAGWPAPNRARVQNMLYRVTLPTGATIIHMGDADPKAQHFTPYNAVWDAKTTHTAFPPYWFLTNDNGKDILTNILHAKDAVGIHVPIKVPQDLKDSGARYLTIPGEVTVIESGDHDAGHSHGE
jgi:L-ascorbate metabolism protein UlaG (beta-lactamase superfamily)